MVTSNTKKWLLALLIITLAGLLVLFILWQTSPTHLGTKSYSATGLPNHSLEQAKQLADTQNKPLLMYFSAYWCPSCRRFDRDVLGETVVAEKIKQLYVFVRVDYDVDGGRELMNSYGIHGVPALLITDPDGNPLRRLPNSYNKEDFLQSL